MGNKYGWHSGVLTCKDIKVQGDLYVQDDIVFSDVSAGTLGVTGGIDMTSTTSAIGIDFSGGTFSTGPIRIGDDDTLLFGAGNDVTMEFDEDGTDDFRVATAAGLGVGFVFTGGTGTATGAGGAFTVTSGASQNATTGTAAASGAITLAVGTPGTATTGTGGAGGAVAITGAAGGATSGAGGTGGAGSSVSITAGAGGADSEGSSGTGGAGGSITLTPGAGGAGNTAGAAGTIVLAGTSPVNATSGGIRTIQAVDDVHDTTPTDAQLDTAFGTPATLGRGFIGTVDDADGDTNFYICLTSDASWYYMKLTKAA